MKVFNTVRQLTVYLIDSDAPLLNVTSGTNEYSCLMSPNLVGKLCHNRIKDIYSPVDNEEDFESNLLSAEFEPTLVQATHDQMESLEETFVLWKQRVDFLTTAADQSPGSQKMEERRP